MQQYQLWLIGWYLALPSIQLTGNQTTSQDCDCTVSAIGVDIDRRLTIPGRESLTGKLREITYRFGFRDLET